MASWRIAVIGQHGSLRGQLIAASFSASIVGRPSQLYTLADHGALKFGEDAHHLEDGLSARRSGVDSLLVEEQVHVVAMNVGEEGDEVRQLARSATLKGNGP